MKNVFSFLTFNGFKQGTISRLACLSRPEGREGVANPAFIRAEIIKWFAWNLFGFKYTNDAGLLSQWE
jgi:hypothetical protein